MSRGFKRCLCSGVKSPLCDSCLTHVRNHPGQPDSITPGYKAYQISVPVLTRVWACAGYEWDGSKKMKAASQLKYRVGSDHVDGGTLFSENLY